jgi:hypothetical protein
MTTRYRYVVTLLIDTDDPAPYTGAARWPGDFNVAGAPWAWLARHGVDDKIVSHRVSRRCLSVADMSDTVSP